MWLETTTGGYVNVARANLLTVEDAAGSTWAIDVHNEAGQIARLNGSYASGTEAQAAAAKLVVGIDPTTITGGS